MLYSSCSLLYFHFSILIEWMNRFVRPFPEKENKEKETRYVHATKGAIYFAFSEKCRESLTKIHQNWNGSICWEKFWKTRNFEKLIFILTNFGRLLWAVKTFHTSFFQKSASIQPRTSFSSLEVILLIFSFAFLGSDAEHVGLDEDGRHQPDQPEHADDGRRAAEVGEYAGVAEEGRAGIGEGDHCNLAAFCSQAREIHPQNSKIEIQEICKSWLCSIYFTDVQCIFGLLRKFAAILSNTYAVHRRSHIILLDMQEIPVNCRKSKHSEENSNFQNFQFSSNIWELSTFTKCIEILVMRTAAI